jgi:hypothetical protein
LEDLEEIKPPEPEEEKPLHKNRKKNLNKWLWMY